MGPPSGASCGSKACAMSAVSIGQRFRSARDAPLPGPAPTTTATGFLFFLFSRHASSIDVVIWLSGASIGSLQRAACPCISRTQHPIATRGWRGLANSWRHLGTSSRTRKQCQRSPIQWPPWSNKHLSRSWPSVEHVHPSVTWDDRATPVSRNASPREGGRRCDISLLRQTRLYSAATVCRHHAAPGNLRPWAAFGSRRS